MIVKSSKGVPVLVDFDDMNIRFYDTRFSQPCRIAEYASLVFMRHYGSLHHRRPEWTLDGQTVSEIQKILKKRGHA